MRIMLATGPPSRLMASSWPGALSHEDSVSFASGHASIETSCWQIGTAPVGQNASSRSYPFPKIFTCRTFQPLWASLSSGSTDCASFSMTARLEMLTSPLSTGLVFSNHFGTLAILRRCASIQKPPRLHGQTALAGHPSRSMRRPDGIHSEPPETSALPDGHRIPFFVWRPQPDKFRTESEYRTKHLARKRRYQRTVSGRSADACQTFVQP